MPLAADLLPATLRSLPAKVAKLESELKELRAARRLAHSSIDGGSVTIRDTTGAVRAVLGNQADGTVALTAVTGPVPPTPTDPVVTAQLAALSVTWDGGLVGGAALSADWMRVEVHVSATAGFTPDQTTLRQTIETPAGGTVLIALGYTAWYVKLRSVTTSGAVSAPTADVSGTPNQAGAGDITATAIDGKTITGAVIRTAATGQRVVINQGNNNEVDFYDSSGTLIMSLGSTTNGSLTIWNGGANDPVGLNAGIMTFYTVGGGGLLTPDVQVYAHSGGTVFFNTQLNGGVAFQNGNWVKLHAGSDTLETWQAPSYATNWSTSTTFAGVTGYQALAYRKDAEDNLWLYGCFAAGATLPGSTVATLPAGYRPLSARGVVAVLHRSGSTTTVGMLQVNTDGTVLAVPSTGVTVAASDTFFVNGKVPLGNLA